MTSHLIGEFFGTMILILLGDGVVAGVLLKRSKAEGSGWIVITTGWAMAVMAGVFTALAFGSSDAHLNPAVTLGFGVATGAYAKFLPYLAAQMLGAFAGATLVWLHYYPHWKETADPAAKLACFCTGPAIRKPLANLLSEIIATFVLVLVAGAIFSKNISADGPCGGIGAVPCGKSGVGNWAGARRDYGLRDQSGARPGAAVGARAAAYRGEGRIGLVLCGDTVCWAVDWGRARGGSVADISCLRRWARYRKRFEYAHRPLCSGLS